MEIWGDMHAWEICMQIGWVEYLWRVTDMHADGAVRYGEICMHAHLRAVDLRLQMLEPLEQRLAPRLVGRVVLVVDELEALELGEHQQQPPAKQRGGGGVHGLEARQGEER